ncbi:hypothetical protein [Luteococcus sp.]|uniref:hypothetical protein n=1 Tax=Luteococcus sp. TaxID=1969402 RepID=UPI0037369F65
MRARLGACLVALPLILAASACSDGDQTEEPTAPGQVELGYALPAGMKEVAIPSATPTAGMQYDIKLFTGKNDCELRVVRMKLPKGDGTEDQDATYNMLGAIMESSGVQNFTTNGHMLPGEPGPVPALSVSGSSKDLDLRAAGRISNDSLQGFQMVYGCKKGTLDQKTWQALVDSLKVDDFKGSLKMH